MQLTNTIRILLFYLLIFAMFIFTVNSMNMHIPILDDVSQATLSPITQKFNTNDKVVMRALLFAVAVWLLSNILGMKECYKFDAKENWINQYNKDSEDVKEGYANLEPYCGCSNSASEIVQENEESLKNKEPIVGPRDSTCSSCGNGLDCACGNVKKITTYSSAVSVNSATLPEQRKVVYNSALNLSKASMCKGPSYLWSGDGEFSKMCQGLVQNNDGRCALGRFNCNTGFVGEPTPLFEYSSSSDSNWQGIPCQNGDPVKEKKEKKVCNDICGY